MRIDKKHEDNSDRSLAIVQRRGKRGRTTNNDRVMHPIPKRFVQFLHKMCYNTMREFLSKYVIPKFAKILCQSAFWQKKHQINARYWFAPIWLN